MMGLNTDMNNPFGNNFNLGNFSNVYGMLGNNMNPNLLSIGGAS